MLLFFYALYLELASAAATLQASQYTLYCFLFSLLIASVLMGGPRHSISLSLRQNCHFVSLHYPFQHCDHVSSFSVYGGELFCPKVIDVTFSQHRSCGCWEQITNVLWIETNVDLCCFCGYFYVAALLTLLGSHRRLQIRDVGNNSESCNQANTLSIIDS